MGAHTGDLRVIANYRNQWRQINGAPLTTGMLQADKAFHYYSHEIDGGIMYARDQFSGFQTITNKIYLAGAYGYDWLSSHWRGGIQLGVVSNSTDLSTQTFPTNGIIQTEHLVKTFTMEKRIFAPHKCMLT